MFEWIWKKPEPPKPMPPHIPIELRLYTEFNGDLVACAKWFAKEYKTQEWGDLVMMQILLIERMNTLIASSTNKQD